MLHLYTPTNLLRLKSGLLSGMTLAALLLWLIGAVVLPYDRPRQAVVQSLWDVGLLVAVNFGFAALVVQQQIVFSYPVALVEVVGRVTRWSQVLAPGAFALLRACAVLAGSAALIVIAMMRQRA